MKTLVAYSGGLDSTYLLWKILTETEDEVTALYLDYSSVKKQVNTDRSGIKLEMVETLIERLYKIRPFKFEIYKVKESEITNDLKHKNLFFINYASKFINNGDYDRLAHGSSYEDRRQKFVRHLDYTPTHYAEQRLFDKLCVRGTLWRPLTTDEWHKKYNRLYAMINLPKEILRDSNSCDRIKKVETVSETQFQKCNVCPKCLINKKYIELYKSGYTLEQVTEWRHEKSLKYGKNELMSSYVNWIEHELGLSETVKHWKRHYLKDEIKSEGIWEGLIKEPS